MTRDEAVAVVKQVLGFRQTLDATIVSNMVLAQTTFELGPIKPWWMRQETTLALVADTATVAVPSGFIEEDENDGLFYIPSDSDEEEVELIKDDLDVLRRTYRGADAGAPEAYALAGDTLYFFPTPDASYSVRMAYYKRDQTLDSNIENGWLKHVPYLLIGEAGILIASSLRDAEAKSQFRDMKAAGMLILQSQATGREMSNRRLQMGGRH